MSDLNQILNDKPGWREKFHAMPISGNCDARCGKPAKMWFGNTNQATCGAEKCYSVLYEDYMTERPRYDEE